MSYQVEGTDLTKLVELLEWLLDQEVSEVLQALEQLVLNRWVAAGQGGVKGGAAGPRAAGPHR